MHHQLAASAHLDPTPQLQSASLSVEIARSVIRFRVQIHAALLLFFVMCNIPFRVVESPHFLRLLNQLRPNYSAPGA